MTKYAKSTKCPVCGCSVMVRKVENVPVRLTTALALADHAKTLHQPAFRFSDYRRA